MRDVEDEYVEMLGEHIAQWQRRRVVAPREDDHGSAVTGLEVANLRSVQLHEAFREYRGRTVWCIEYASHFALRYFPAGRLLKNGFNSLRPHSERTSQTP